MKRAERLKWHGVQGPALGPLVGSRGNAPGGGPGGGAPGSSEVLGILSQKDGHIFRPFCNMTRPYGYCHSRTKQTCIHFKLAEPNRSFNIDIAIVAVVS